MRKFKVGDIVVTKRRYLVMRRYIAMITRVSSALKSDPHIAVASCAPWIAKEVGDRELISLISIDAPELSWDHHFREDDLRQANPREQLEYFARKRVRKDKIEANRKAGLYKHLSV